MPETGTGAAAGAGGGAGAGSGAGGGAGAGAGGMGTAGMAIEYGGVVLASVSSDGASETYTAFAAFQKGGSLDFDRCADCCCFHGIGLPLPEKPPDAGVIELTRSQEAMPFATLSPELDVLHGSWLLGSWGLGGISDYAPIYGISWNPGEDLGVSAAGNEVHAFSGRLPTPRLLAEVEPPIGAEAVTIDRASEFVLAWAPESRDESVLLLLQQFGTETGLAACYCTAHDSGGQFRLSVETLSQFGTDPGEIQLSRSIVSNAASDNATVGLVGQVAVTGSVEFR